MLALKKILLPVDFSDKSAAVAHYAKAFALRFRSEVTLLHVIQAVELIGTPEVGVVSVIDLNAERLAAVEARLDEFLSAELEGLPVRRVVTDGDPAHQIVQHAHNDHVDLVMTATHGFGRFRQFLLGSVVAKVLHDADCPVWTAVHHEQAPAVESISFARIACAINLGPHTQTVLSWALSIAAQLGARLSVIHILPGAGAPPGSPDSQQAERRREQIRELLRDKGAADVAVASGDVPRQIREIVLREAADLLVIGRGAGKGMVGRLRSHAYAIIRDSPCPVVSV
jgi:nucleotide-binding universal stress UspA family protein